MISLAKLDRLAIGSILRSKLVFLVNVRLRKVLETERRLRLQIFAEKRGIHSAECVDIDNESNQVP